MVLSKLRQKRKVRETVDMTFLIGASHLHHHSPACPPHRAQYPTIPGLLGHLTHVTNPWTDSERDCLFHSFLPPSLSSPSMGNSQPDCSDSLLWFHKGQHFKSSLQAFFPSLPPSLPSFRTQGRLWREEDMGREPGALLPHWGSSTLSKSQDTPQGCPQAQDAVAGR